MAPLLPTRGAVEVVYEPEPVEGRPSVGRTIAGFDAGSGAWYFMNGETVVGVDARGMKYGGKPRYGAVRELGPAAVGADEIVERFFPFLFVRDVLTRPVVIRSIERRAEGGFRISAEFPGGRRRTLTEFDISGGVDASPELAWAEIDGQGLVLSRWSGSASPADANRIEYDERSTHDFPVAHALPSGRWRLVSCDYYADTPPSMFDRARIEERAVKESLRLASERIQISLPASEPAPGDDPARRGAWNPLARYRFPLVATGLIALVIASYAWWKRR